MAIGGRSAGKRVLRRVEQWLRYWLFARHAVTDGWNLPCDSKSPGLCYACHKLRDRLTGSHVIGDGPVVIFTRHAPVWAHLYHGDPRASRVYSSRGRVVAQYGSIPSDFFLE